MTDSKPTARDEAFANTGPALLAERIRTGTEPGPAWWHAVGWRDCEHRWELDGPYPLLEVLKILSDFAHSRLIDHDYDGHGWEVLQSAKCAAQRMLARADQTLPQRLDTACDWMEGQAARWIPCSERMPNLEEQGRLCSVEYFDGSVGSAIACDEFEGGFLCRRKWIDKMGRRMKEDTLPPGRVRSFYVIPEPPTERKAER